MKYKYKVGNRFSLEKYFLKFLLPEFNAKDISDSKKNIISLSLREHLGIVLLSFFATKVTNRNFYPAINEIDSDDGAIVDIENKLVYDIEQVYIYNVDENIEITECLLNELEKKNTKSYLENTSLLIFVGIEGELIVDNIHDEIISHNIANIYLYGLRGPGLFDFEFMILKENGIYNFHRYLLSINESTGKCNLQEIG